MSKERITLQDTVRAAVLSFVRNHGNGSVTVFDLDTGDITVEAGDEKVTVRVQKTSEVESEREDLRFLVELQAAGVDNWSGYTVARRAMREEW